MIAARGLAMPCRAQKQCDIVRRAILEPRRDCTVNRATSCFRYVLMARVANEVVRHLDRVSMPNDQWCWGQACLGGMGALRGPVEDLRKLVSVHRPPKQHD